MSITSIPFISEFIKNMGTLEQRLNGEITMFHYIALFLFSSFVYYFIGWIIEIILRKRFNKFEGNKFKYLTFVLFSTLVLIILFMIFAELFMRISNVVGQRIEQFQRCSNKDGFNTYQWKNLRFEFYCKNWQYNGSYRVYDNGVPDKEYTYKDGHLVCQKQYQCYIDLKQ